MLLENYWYVIAESSSVTDKPIRVKALNAELVVYRRPSDKKVVVLSNRCVHRGASLSEGKVVNNCLACPYHGWRYDSEGVCVEIPAQPSRSLPQKARVDSYPTEERYGWVWAFLGDLPESQRPALPKWDHLHSSELRSVRGEYLWQAHYTRVVENAVDIAHTPFLHHRSFGNADHPEMPDYEVSVPEKDAIQAQVRLPIPNRLALAKSLFPSMTNDVTLTIHMPNINCLDTVFPNGWRFHLVLVHLPIDERTTKTWFLQSRNFVTTPIFDPIARRISLQILSEDRSVVESQPEPVPLDSANELSVRADALSIAYRKLLRSALERGWSSQTYATDTVIASPQRNQSTKSTWVLQPRRARVPKVTQES